MLTLRQFNIGPPVYAHLLDYDVMEDGQSIGRIREEREPKPGREWFWSLTIKRAHRAGVLTWGYGASLQDAKAAFRLPRATTCNGSCRCRRRFASGAESFAGVAPSAGC